MKTVTKYMYIYIFMIQYCIYLYLGCSLLQCPRKEQPIQFFFFFTEGDFFRVLCGGDHIPFGYLRHIWVHVHLGQVNTHGIGATAFCRRPGLSSLKGEQTLRPIKQITTIYKLSNLREDQVHDVSVMCNLTAVQMSARLRNREEELI